MEVEVTPPSGDTIPFAELEAELKSQITPLDGKTLNELGNFQRINPTIENFAAHLYSRLDFISAEYGAVLNSVVVKESPTRSVKIVRPSATQVAAQDDQDYRADFGRNVVRLPVPPDMSEDRLPRKSAQNRYIDAVHEARSPVGQIPESPNQRDSSEFLPVDEEGADPQEEQDRGEDVGADLERSMIRPKPQERFVTQSDPVTSGSPTPLPSRKDRKKSQGRSLKEDEPLPSDRVGRDRGDRVGFAVTRPRLALLLIILVFVAAAAFLYRNVLWPPVGQGFPWGSDTWGHIRKAQFLLREIQDGNYLPNFSPMWYNGVEPFRYWAPLPYYVLAGLMRLLGDPFLAAGWYVALCALLGASGWLLMKSRFGLAQAGFAGFVWLFWQDNVRVAMSEGNLPRVLATALFPYLLHCFLQVVENPAEKSAGRVAALAVVASVTIIAHAMIAATFFIGLTVMGAFWALWMGIRSKDLGRGILGIFGGIGMSAWWLIPSLQDGIVSIDKEAISEAMQFFPIQVSMNPYLRLSQPEVFYWGVSLVAVVFATVATWKARTRLSRSSMVTGLVFIAASTPTLRPLYRSIPLHHLIFPLYLATVAAGVFLVAAFSWSAANQLTKRDRVVRLAVSLVVLAILAADSYASAGMIATRTEPTYLTDLADHVPRGGWREATLDMSGFGSAATYILSQDSNREQVYGWAWQGATTGPNIVNLNTALQFDYYPFLMDRLVEMGATHIVVRRGITDETELLSHAERLGFEEAWRSPEGIILVADGGPYALETTYSGIVIGRSAANWTSLFPSLATGTSAQIDSYEYEDLLRYPVIVISGAAWEDRTKAEDLLNQLAGAGHKIVVDMEGLPEDVLSKRPVFMGVAGEPILLYKAPTVYEPGSETPHGVVQAFDENYYPWKAHAPQGVEDVVLQFPYLGESVTVLGSKEVGAGSAWFVGANLPYHAYLTKDPYAIDFLSAVLDIEPMAVPERVKMPLTGYEASAKGYSFGIQVPDGAGPVRVQIPIAARDNMVVSVDGVQAKFDSLHNLISLTLDPGRHSVEITPQYPPVLGPAGWVSFGFALCFAILMIGQAVAAQKVPVRGQVLAE